MDAVLDSIHRPVEMEKCDRRNIRILDMLMSILLALVKAAQQPKDEETSVSPMNAAKELRDIAFEAHRNAGKLMSARVQ